MTDTQAAHAPPVAETEPCGDLTTRTLAMPADTNQNGDIFGGWLLEPDGYRRRVLHLQDRQLAHGHGGDRSHEFPQAGVCRRSSFRCTPICVRIGRTSITVHLEAWVMRRKEISSILVTDGNFTYVAIDDQGHPQPVSRS